MANLNLKGSIFFIQTVNTRFKFNACFDYSFNLVVANSCGRKDGPTG